MRECLREPGVNDVTDEDAASQQFTIPTIIPEDVAQMAVHLTEYYQSQRMAYEQVCTMYLS